MKQNSPFWEQSYFTVSLVLSALLVYFYVVVAYTSEWPFLDDYVTTLEFLNRYYASDTFVGKLQAILAQWSEHRIGFGKSITLLYQKLFGRVSFVVLSVLSNLSLVVFYIVLMLQVRKDVRKYLYAPLALILFQLQYYIAQQWLVTSSSFFYMLLFSVLSLHFFRREKWQWAIVFGAIAIYCNANGFLVLLGEGLVLMSQKRWKHSAIFISVLALCMWGYFIGYVPHENDKLKTFYFVYNPWPTILYTLVFIGAPFNLISGMGALAGLAASLFFLWLTYKRYYERNSVVYLILFALFSTAVLAALGRSFWGVEQALESRYKIFSAVLWVCSCIALVEEYAADHLKRYYPIVLGASICFCIGSYFISWQYMVRFRERKQEQFVDIYEDKPLTVMTEAPGILRESIKEGYYVSPVEENK